MVGFGVFVVAEAEVAAVIVVAAKTGAVAGVVGVASTAFAGFIFLYLYSNAKLKVFSNHHPAIVEVSCHPCIHAWSNSHYWDIDH